MKKILWLVCVLNVIACIREAEHFKAYYTRTAYNDKHSGKWADVITEIGESGKLVFGRETGFLPVWETASGKWPVQSLVDRQKDAHQYYSYVRIIENSSKRIVIHVQYVPDMEKADFRSVVHELFTLKPDGRVIRNVKEATKRIDEWENPSNMTTEVMQLTEGGIQTLSLKPAVLSKMKQKRLKSLSVVQTTDEEPALSWLFDEGMKEPGDFTREDVTGELLEVEGHKALWKKGVSGTALAFDGYYSAVRMVKESVPDLNDEWTVEGWAALGAYPFDWAPIVHQSFWNKSGFYLGIDKDGYPGYHVSTGGKWISAVDKNRLDLFHWHHIAGSYNRSSGVIRLFVNGQEKVSLSVRGPFKPSSSDLVMGLNNQKFPVIEGRIRIGKWPSLFGIDGLLDEIRIHDRALAAEEVKERYISLQDEAASKPDFQVRRFPANPQNGTANRFGARYTHLPYHETWDNMWRVTDYSDVVVDFDALPVRLVSWRGFSYGPALVTENGKWAGDQSSENYRELSDPSPAEGCCEHMSDKQCRHAHIRIIENTAARVILHYRYGMVDSRYTFVYSGHDSLDWGDEYWTIYPDGVAVRHLDRGPIWGDSWVETMFFSEPGTRPEDNIDLEAYTLMNMKGEKETYSWEMGSPKCDLDNPIVSMINMKSDYKPFNIYPTDSEVETFPGHGRRSHFHWWNHWPVSQITSDGRGARAADRAAHSSLVWGIPSGNFLMYGLTNQSAESLIPLARSWNHPPAIENCTGCKSLEYRQEERAYYLEAGTGELSFTLKGSEKNPIVNPCFVIKKWDRDDPVRVKTGGSGDDVRQGVVWDTDGSQMLIVWIKKKEFKTFRYKNNKIINKEIRNER